MNFPKMWQASWHGQKISPAVCVCVFFSRISPWSTKKSQEPLENRIFWGIEKTHAMPMFFPEMKIRWGKSLVGSGRDPVGGKPQPPWDWGISPPVFGCLLPIPVSHISNNFRIESWHGVGVPSGKFLLFHAGYMAKWSNSGFRPDLTRPARENNGSVFGKGGREVEPEKGDPTLDDLFWRIENGFASKLLNIVAEKFLLGWPPFVGLY